MASSFDESRIIRAHGVDETHRLAIKLGGLLHAGDTVALVGDLGAGKTTLTQGIAVGLGIPAGVVVNSPTFTILAEHHEGRIPLYHFDVYRLSGPADLYDLAFDEYVDGSGVVVVEWADKIEAALPVDTLRLSIEFVSEPSEVGRPVADDNSSPWEPGTASDRLLRLSAGGQRSSRLIKALLEQE